MPNNADFTIEGGQVVFRDLPPGGHLRRIPYESKNVATLKRLSIASINIQAAKIYIDTLRTMSKETDPHLLDAAILSALVKYGSIFKADRKGFKIDPKQVFTTQVRIIDRSIHPSEMLIDDPDLELLRCHEKFISLRDKFIAHDDKIIGQTECFAIFKKSFRCDRVLALTQRSSVYSAIKEQKTQLPMCIDAVFTWLAFEKERYCQLVTDEINLLSLKARRRFPPPTFDAYRGLPDAEERKARRDPFWIFNWITGRLGIRRAD